MQAIEERRNFFKGSKLSFKKQEKFLECFSRDMPATQTAAKIAVDVKNINIRYNRLRELMFSNMPTVFNVPNVHKRIDIVQKYLWLYLIQVEFISLFFTNEYSPNKNWVLSGKVDNSLSTINLIITAHSAFVKRSDNFDVDLFKQRLVSDLRIALINNEKTFLSIDFNSHGKKTYQYIDRILDIDMNKYLIAEGFRTTSDRLSMYKTSQRNWTQEKQTAFFFESLYRYVTIHNYGYLYLKGRISSRSLSAPDGNERFEFIRDANQYTYRYHFKKWGNQFSKIIEFDLRYYLFIDPDQVYLKNLSDFEDSFQKFHDQES